MTNKKIIIDDIDVNALNSDEIACMNRYEVARLFVKTVERLVAKEQENEELRQYHNKCCEENAKKLEEWLEKYNQVSRDFHNGKYCNEENCNLLKAKEQELKNICKAFDIEYAIDEETGNLIGRCNKLYKKEQECNKLYIQLKADEEYHKEEENTLRKIIKNKEERNIELYKENNQLKVNNEKMSKCYAELTEIVSPYIDDFTGYNEKLGSFDIVLCVKELLQQINKLKAEQDKIKAIGDNYFDEYEMCCLDLPDAIDSLLKRYDNAFARFKKERKELKEDNEELKNLLKVRIEDLCDSCGASSMMPMPCKVYEKTLIEIKEIIKQGVKIHDDIIVSKQILQKINECGVENA